MSDSFDAEAIRDSSERRREIKEAAALNKRLIDCPPHNALYGVFGELSNAPIKKHKRPSATIDGPTTVHVYGKDGKENLKVKHTLDSAAIKYHFPDGLTVTKLRATPLTYRLDDADGRQLVVCRSPASRKKPSHWEVMGLPFGFRERRGLHAAHRLRGHGPTPSFE